MCQWLSSLSLRTPRPPNRPWDCPHISGCPPAFSTLLVYSTLSSFQAVLAGDLDVLLDFSSLLTAHIQPPPTSVASTLMYISDGLVSLSSLLFISFQSCHHSFPGYYQCLLVIFCKFAYFHTCNPFSTQQETQSKQYLGRVILQLKAFQTLLLARRVKFVYHCCLPKTLLDLVLLLHLVSSFSPHEFDPSCLL